MAGPDLYGVLTLNRQKEKRSEIGKFSRHFLSSSGIQLFSTLT